MSDTNFKNLEDFQQFANSSELNELNKIDMMHIALEMKNNVPLATNQFTNVITEVRS